MEVVFSLDKIDQAASDLVRFGSDIPVWIFPSEMGSGKTTLIRALCAVLGVEGEVSSPTFSIVNPYPLPSGTIYHFDLYRLKNENELRDIGFEEYLDSGALCLIEWPQLAMPFLSSLFLEVNLKPVNEQQRILTAVKHGTVPA
ncbi:MAG: tRNA (adenosine(37)-N6)-threonylcarbamoyltransferase complex ATPase subunit type 1 TsaE [Mucilaginibacter polytrichastri]|nr:tRNA (adenosine(37)-N6)-threonylcarbamoyltransferase complex ATPase subunit type 1 TsaE [Mucilaginibacter polytrichastri]